MIKILYVDDEKINLDLFKLSFRDTYEVITADSANIALQILDTTNNIKLVITDMKMPGMNGIEFIEKARIKYSNIPYIVMSGYSKTPQITKALEEGMIMGYFTKPFNKKKLQKEIDNTLII